MEINNLNIRRLNYKYANSFSDYAWIQDFLLDNNSDKKELPNRFELQGKNINSQELHNFLIDNNFVQLIENNKKVYQTFTSVTEKLYKMYMSSDKSIVLMAYTDDVKKDPDILASLTFFYFISDKVKLEKLIGGIDEMKHIEISKKKEINIISMNSDDYTLLPFPIKNFELDINTNYNDDFSEIHELILKSLNEPNSLCLLHSDDAGCGKTNYIKYLSSLINKKMIFLPPNLANQLASPNFVNFLLKHKNSILIIEDAENVIKKRESGENQAISNLLNITNGLLSDILNIGVIATFNCNYDEVDAALKRKGRLSAEYNFKKLKKEKAIKLAEKLGLDSSIITSDMTLADVYNLDKKDFKKSKSQPMGFKISA